MFPIDFQAFALSLNMSPDDTAVLTDLYRRFTADPTFPALYAQVRKSAAMLDAPAADSIITALAAKHSVSMHSTEAVLLLMLGIDAKPVYDQYRISQQVYLDSMADIVTWMRLCRKETGEVGTLHNFGWLMQPMLPRILKLGRLQFEMVVWQNDTPHSSIYAYPKNIPAGKQVLNVHIPEGEPLSHDACLASYEQAKVFFPKHFDFHPQVFCCHSWLLAPQLKEILPPDSNILKFAADFTILSAEQDSDAEWRIFGSKRPHEQKTRLQQRAYAYLAAGNKIGCGLGVIQI